MVHLPASHRRIPAAPAQNRNRSQYKSAYHFWSIPLRDIILNGANYSAVPFIGLNR
jgi:hypothetical protein